MSIADKIKSGDILTMSRLIRDIDDGMPEAEITLQKLFKHSGDSKILGITGLPGAGKSTLTSLLISYYRKQNKRVGVVAVDPTSPFSGGAILGDRIRMQEHNADSDVFIKSVATRGSFGGLSKSVVDIVRIMEAAGKDIIIIETVGVGQDEIDVVRLAGQVLVVTAPGLGDDIQAIKAGILEIADIFVVNKCDLVGAEKAASELKDAAEDNITGDLKPIVMTDSIHIKGIDELTESIDIGFDKFNNDNIKNEYLDRRYRYEIEYKVRDKLTETIRESFENDPVFKDILKAVRDKKMDPYTAVTKIMKNVKLT
ncbi:MAG: methylmalonyl Co-A mutase-associated GTPase MeaB [Deltaproteobacteria bacterium]|jgi:LAO/AO transport system kinase|nr:methylmalonyl Co-A mutase-associated GTPase MeaB [Deltaproteobacteria bacterium]